MKHNRNFYYRYKYRDFKDYDYIDALDIESLKFLKQFDLEYYGGGNKNMFKLYFKGNFMNIKEYKIKIQSKLCFETINFINKWHYTTITKRTVLKEKYVFTLWFYDTIIGVSVFGEQFSIRGQKKYGKNCLELRRLCLIDDTPKNSESFFIGYCLRELKKLKVQSIISYADPHYNHIGTIYKASNFKYLGTSYSNKFYKLDEKIIHARMFYQKKNGVYVPSALKYQELLKIGKIKKIVTPAKHIYFYNLNNKGINHE